MSIERTKEEKVSEMEALKQDTDKLGVSSKMIELLKINNLDFRMPPALSVVTKRSLIQHFFDKNVYRSGQNMVCILNGGDGYVDGRSSYLTFKIRVIGTGGGTATLGNGSAINVINRVTLTTESGTEVERLEGLNNYRNTVDRYTHSQDWFDSYGEVIGYKKSGGQGTLAGTATLTSGTITLDGEEFKNNSVTFPKAPVEQEVDGTVFYVIPLNKIAGLFDTNKLLAGIGLLSGMRVEIALEQLRTALKWTSATDRDYEVFDCSIMMDTYQISDSILKALNTQSATKSLEIIYHSYDRTPASIPSGVLPINIDAKRAVSRSIMAFGKIRSQNAVTLDTADSFDSDTYDITTQQYQLAGNFYPNAPIKNNYEAYQHAQYAFDKLRTVGMENSVSVSNFISKYGIIPVNLQRSAVLGQSGLPLSGSRILQLRAELSNALPSANREVDLFVQYVKVVRVFLDRAIVKE